MEDRQIENVPISNIKAQSLERKVTDQGISELASSIKDLGILEPLLVLKTPKGFTLLAGKRRLMAAKSINLDTVPCLVLEADQARAFSITMHENLYRENLNPVDEADIYRQLRDKHRYQTKEIAKMVGRTEGYVSQRLAIILWPEPLTKALFHEAISFSVARVLSGIGDLKHMNWLLKHAIDSGCTYRQANRWLADWKSTPTAIAQDTDYTKAPDEQTTPEPIKRPCWWCNNFFEYDQLTAVDFCPNCIKGLLSAREASSASKP